MAILEPIVENEEQLSLLAKPELQGGMGVRVVPDKEEVSSSLLEATPEDDVAEKTTPLRRPVTSRNIETSSSPVLKPIEDPKLDDRSVLEKAADKFIDSNVSPVISLASTPSGRQLLLQGALGLSEDEQKDAIASSVNQVENLKRTINYLKHRNSLPEAEQKALDESIKNESAETYQHLTESIGLVYNIKEPLFDLNTGRLVSSRTALTDALVTTAGPLSTALTTSTVIPGPIGVGTGLIVGAITYNALSPPEETLTNTLKDLGFTEGKAMDSLVHAVTTEDLSEESRNRSIKVIEEIILLGAVPAAKGVIGTSSKVVNGVNQNLMPHLEPFLRDLKKPYELLTENEKAEVVFESLRSAGRQVQRQAGTTDKGIGKGFKNIFAAIERLSRTTFLSSGLSPKILRNAQEQSKQDIQANIQRASNLTQKLDSLIDETAGKAKNSEIREAIQSALTVGFDMIPPTGTIDTTDVKKLLRKNNKYNVLNDDLLDIVVEMRANIDDLSYELLSSMGGNANTKEAKKLLNTVRANVGTYLNTSYRIHSKGWKVDEKIKAETIDIFAARYIEKDESLSMEEAIAKATDTVNEKIEAAKITPRGVSGDFDITDARNTGILERKDLKDEALKKLFEEVLDPSENYLVTMSKLGELVAQSKYFDNFYDIGTKSSVPFLFKAGSVRDQGKYTYKIKGTNSKLDGLYTTPEMGIVLQNKQAALTPVLGSIMTSKAITSGGMLTMLGANPTVINLASVKGLTQKAKTVWSLTTHQRNGIGASFMTLAQGHNPFTKDAFKSFKAVAGKTDEESVALRLKLTELGVTGSSPRLGEYKELLSEYRKIMELDETSEVGAEQFYKFVRNNAEKLGVGKLNLSELDDVLTKVYQGTDDFFKASLWAKERETLKKAYPEASEEFLDLEAAELVKNGLPNYNRITPGVKGLRNVPVFGAFLGFSSELIRTGLWTLKQSTKEVKSGNAVIAKRGGLRLASFTGIAGSSSYLAENMSAKAVGFTEAKLQAFKDFYKSEFGEQTYMFVADEEGQIDSINLTYTDPWTILRQPFTEATRSYNEGLITEENYNKILFDTTVRFAKTAVRPFVSETVANQAVANLISTLQTGDRINGGGFDKDTGGQNTIDRIPAALTNFFVDIGPNVITEAGQIKDILIDEEAVGSYVEPKDKEDYIFKRFTTLDRQPVQLLSGLKKVTNNYKYASSDIKRIPKASQSNSYEDLVEKYVDANTLLVEEASKLYLKLKAVDTFYSETSESRRLAASTFRKYAVENSDFLLVSRGFAPQITVSYDTIWNQTKSLRAEGKVPNTAIEFRPWFNKFKTDITLPSGKTDLNKQEVDPADQIVLDSLRVNKDKGGVLEDPSMFRSDGSQKSAVGYLGAIENKVEGGTMTEVSVGLKINGQELIVPTMVPTLTTEEINILSNMKLEGNAKNIPLSIINKAKEHALKRIEEGKSVFYVDGEERLNKEKGGEVEVPNAPEEPDERIDKMTGLPYNLQAGIPFRDEEDPLKRLGLVGGGKAVDPIERLGFAVGGIQKGIKTAVEGGTELVSKAEEVLEVSSKQVTKAFKYLMDIGAEETPRSVMPAPQRFFDPNNKDYKPFIGSMGEQPGGRYLEMGGKSPQDITEEFPSRAVIEVTPEGKPVMQVSKELLEGEVRTDGRKIKTNLFKKKAGWKWTKTPEGFDPKPPSNFSLVSVEDGRQHYYSLRTEFPEGVSLARYEKSKSEPRLRPTKKGNVHLGEVVGEISVRGKKHPVYDQIKVYGLAGATASSLLKEEEIEL